MNITEQNKNTLISANAANTKGDYEGFLSFCTEDTTWSFIGERILEGKEAVRQWMKETYQEPPKFSTLQLIAEGDFVTALGKITLKGKDGEPAPFSYCDVWRFRDGKIAELQAFVIADSS